MLPDGQAGPPPVPTRQPGTRRWCAMFFIQAHAIALWYVPFSGVLKSHGYEAIVPEAFALTGVAAFISPMLAGALADQHTSPTRILRILAIGIAATLALTFHGIASGWNASLILGLFLFQQLWAAPAWSIANTIILNSLDNPEQHFGPIRVWATYGWMVAGLLIGFVLNLDGNIATGYAGSMAWLGVAVFTLFIPNIRPQSPKDRPRFKDLLGLETFRLLRIPRNRAVFITAGLLTIPVAAFYPFVPLQLQDIGLDRTSGIMALGQITEAAAMYLLAPMLGRFGLRNLLLVAIAASLLRYGFFAANQSVALIVGVLLHGICFTFFFIPAQIYIEQHVPKSMRFRAQAMMTLLVGGCGNLLGFLGCGWLRKLCVTTEGITDWPTYWSLLNTAILVALFYFVWEWRKGPHAPAPPSVQIGKSEIPPG